MTAKTSRSRMFHGSAAASTEVEPQLQGQLGQQELTVVHQFKSDSTHQQAAEKSRVHTSVVRSSIAYFSLEDFQRNENRGDLQPLVEGTGAELHGFIVKVMECVGCPSWLTRSAESRDNPARFAVYLFCFDAGGESQSHLRRVHRDVVMMWVLKENKWLGKSSGDCQRGRVRFVLCPTPLSHVVGHEGDEIRTLMCGLLESDVGEGP